jgi:carboxymethylenebutenolidase
MAERTVYVTTADGRMEVFVVHPDGPGPFPVLIQFMDVSGMREELRRLARRGAAMGYYVLQPDVLYRDGITGPVDLGNPANREPLMRAAMNVTPERLESDMRAMLAIAEADGAARPGPVGVYGFCMGGNLAVVLAERLGDGVAAVGSIHPGYLVTEYPNSPHLHLGNIRAECYFSIGEQDHMSTPEQVSVLEGAMKGLGIRHSIDWPQAPHGFIFPDRAGQFNDGASEKVWADLKQLFDRALK